MHRLHIDYQRRQLELFLAQILRYRVHHFRFEDMVYRDLQSYTGEWTGIAWVPQGYGFGENLNTVGFAVAQHYGQILRTILVRQALDDSLVFEVHRACGSSNKAL